MQGVHEAVRRFLEKIPVRIDRGVVDQRIKRAEGPIEAGKGRGQAFRIAHIGNQGQNRFAGLFGEAFQGGRIAPQGPVALQTEVWRHAEQLQVVQWCQAFLVDERSALGLQANPNTGTAQFGA